MLTSAFRACSLAAATAVLLAAGIARADCVDRMRDMTAAERAYHQRGVAALAAALPGPPAGAELKGRPFDFKAPSLSAGASVCGAALGNFNVTADAGYLYTFPKAEADRLYVERRAVVERIRAIEALPPDKAASAPALILGQRNAEWCGHGPILEEDIALSNNSLDLIGQARMLYQHAAETQGGGATEDTLAYFRDVPDFRNYTLCELPHTPLMSATAQGDRDFAMTMARNFLYSSLMVLVWDQLQNSKDAQLAAIAAKSLKEVRYHLRHSRDWLVRLGDGTDESHAKAQAALDQLIPYTQEFWAVSPHEAAALANGTGIDMAALQNDWNQIVNEALQEATLKRPADGGFVPTGKQGIHSEHLGFVLAEMQSLARSHPQATW